MTLSYCGTISWSPEDVFDRPVRTWFDRHQRSEKSFGTALGPDAARYLSACLRRLGYRVTMAASPWRLDGTQTQLQQMLITGLAQAARELCPRAQADISAWVGRRQAVLAQSTLRIGHVDLFARLDHHG
jgi:hypothetical protein